MTRVTSDENKNAMCAYLDAISSMNGDIPGKVERGRTEEDLVTIESYSVVKEGCDICLFFNLRPF